jgi:peptidoglycan/LPS O-acetylase OafA/YrhL
VVVFHAFPATIPGGFIGVDVFFVISGYLISSVILQDLDCGKFSPRDFYARRIRRIFRAFPWYWSSDWP